MTSTLVSILAFGLPAIALLCLAIGWISYLGLVHYRILDPARIEERLLESGEASAEQLALPWIRDTVLSRGGYGIRVYALRGSADRLLLFHHGVGWNWLVALRYMDWFRKAGWTLVALDSRGHGATREGSDPGRRGGRRALSGRKAARPSYGVFEKEDLRSVADWALERFPHGGGFVALGESMGAAAVLQYAAMESRLDAVVADSSFTCAREELDWRLRSAIVPWPFRPLAILFADRLCRAIDGFSLFDADPERAILETELPMLFIHGLEDRYVPWRMSVIMAESRRRALPRAITELLLVPGARHVKAVSVDPKGYAEALVAFLDKSLERSGGTR